MDQIPRMDQSPKMDQSLKMDHDRDQSKNNRNLKMDSKNGKQT